MRRKEKPDCGEGSETGGKNNGACERGFDAGGHQAALLEKLGDAQVSGAARQRRIRICWRNCEGFGVMVVSTSDRGVFLRRRARPGNPGAKEAIADGGWRSIFRFPLEGTR